MEPDVGCAIGFEYTSEQFKEMVSCISVEAERFYEGINGFMCEARFTGTLEMYLRDYESGRAVLDFMNTCRGVMDLQDSYDRDVDAALQPHGELFDAPDLLPQKVREIACRYAEQTEVLYLRFQASHQTLLNEIRALREQCQIESNVDPLSQNGSFGEVQEWSEHLELLLHNVAEAGMQRFASMQWAQAH
ncbi:hypothetical protein AB0N09_34680 [Streptomyces erythrochromogenes]|uniref:hypothetical protein n=1 Tax=Streptomyces erythrochromogenes TaxID=285574 RepID=UPI003418B6DA